MRFDPEVLLDPIKPMIFLDPDMFYQAGGSYMDSETPCCVGAHMANLLDVAYNCEDDFLAGIDKWISIVGGNRAHAILMLREAGAGHNPLSGVQWATPFSDVWQNLWRIEQLPSLSNVDLSGTCLHEVNFKRMDLHGSSFSAAYVNESNFKHANLRNCNFHKADCEGANFKYANLSNARFGMAYVGDIKTKGAITDGVNWSEAILKRDMEE